MCHWGRWYLCVRSKVKGVVPKFSLVWAFSILSPTSKPSPGLPSWLLLTLCITGGGPCYVFRARKRELISKIYLSHALHWVQPSKLAPKRPPRPLCILRVTGGDCNTSRARRWAWSLKPLLFVFIHVSLSILLYFHGVSLSFMKPLRLTGGLYYVHSRKIWSIT